MSVQRSIRSALAPFTSSMREPDPDGAWKFMAEKWHREGVVVLIPDEIERRKGWALAQNARNVAEECFGKRKVNSK